MEKMVGVLERMMVVRTGKQRKEDMLTVSAFEGKEEENGQGKGLWKRNNRVEEEFNEINHHSKDTELEEEEMNMDCMQQMKEPTPRGRMLKKLKRMEIFMTNLKMKLSMERIEQGNLEGVTLFQFWAWLMKFGNFFNEEEAKQFGNDLIRHGYIYCIEHGLEWEGHETCRYEIQKESYWPLKKCDETCTNHDYAVYLTQRTLRDRKKHALEEYEEDRFIQLKKRLEHNWYSVVKKAESEVKKLKTLPKNEKKLIDVQNRAFWGRLRPAPQIEKRMIEMRRNQTSGQGRLKSNVPKELTLNEEALAIYYEQDIVRLEYAMRQSRIPVSIAAKSLTMRCLTCAPFDPFLTTPEPFNPWIVEEQGIWYDMVERKSKLCPNDDDVRRWSLSLFELLNDPKGVHWFLKFCESEHSQENIKFWMECKQMKSESVDRKEFVRRALAIFENYVKQGASQEINIESKNREYINYCINMFNEYNERKGFSVISNLADNESVEEISSMVRNKAELRHYDFTNSHLSTNYNEESKSSQRPSTAPQGQFEKTKRRQVIESVLEMVQEEQVARIKAEQLTLRSSDENTLHHGADHGFDTTNEMVIGSFEGSLIRTADITSSSYNSETEQSMNHVQEIDHTGLKEMAKLISPLLGSMSENFSSQSLELPSNNSTTNNSEDSYASVLAQNSKAILIDSIASDLLSPPSSFSQYNSDSDQRLSTIVENDDNSFLKDPMTPANLSRVVHLEPRSEKVPWRTRKSSSPIDDFQDGQDALTTKNKPRRQISFRTMLKEMDQELEIRQTQAITKSKDIDFLARKSSIRRVMDKLTKRDDVNPYKKGISRDDYFKDVTATIYDKPTIPFTNDIPCNSLLSWQNDPSLSSSLSDISPPRPKKNPWFDSLNSSSYDTSTSSRLSDSASLKIEIPSQDETLDIVKSEPQEVIRQLREMILSNKSFSISAEQISPIVDGALWDTSFYNLSMPFNYSMTDFTNIATNDLVNDSIFDHALRHIYMLIAKDIYPRFIHSTYLCANMASSPFQ